MVNRRRHQPRGTTLIEAMAAMGIFAFGIVGVMQMQMIAAYQNSYAAKSVRGSMLARGLADALGRHAYSQIDSCEQTAINTEAEIEAALEADLKASNLELLEADSVFTAADVDLDAEALPGGCLLDKVALDGAAAATDGYRRFVVIRPYTDPTTGEESAAVAAAVVAWREGGRLRSAMAYTIVADPSLSGATIPGL